MDDFIVLILEGQLSSAVAISRDILHVASQLAPSCALAVPRWRMCSIYGGQIALQGGFAVQTEALPAQCAAHTLWIIPGLGVPERAALRLRLQAPDVEPLVARMREHLAQGGHIAAGCTAVFLLQQAGALDGRSATVTWWLAPFLQKLAPHCRVDADRMLCSDGPLTTCGAALAQIDLMLYLLRSRCGSELTAAVSRVLVLDARQAQQAAFIVPQMMVSGDALVARLSARIEQALPDAPSVESLAAECCISERTLARHIRKATGKSTIALIQNIRFMRARHLLENSRMTVEQVAAAVGYSDATALRKLMRKVSGGNPSQSRALRTPKVTSNAEAVKRKPKIISTNVESSPALPAQPHHVPAKR